MSINQCSAETTSCTKRVLQEAARSGKWPSSIRTLMYLTSLMNCFELKSTPISVQSRGKFQFGNDEQKFLRQRVHFAKIDTVAKTSKILKQPRWLR